MAGYKIAFSLGSEFNPHKALQKKWELQKRLFQKAHSCNKQKWDCTKKKKPHPKAIFFELQENVTGIRQWRSATGINLVHSAMLHGHETINEYLGFQWQKVQKNIEFLKNYSIYKQTHI